MPDTRWHTGIPTNPDDESTGGYFIFLVQLSSGAVTRAMYKDGRWRRSDDLYNLPFEDDEVVRWRDVP